MEMLQHLKSKLAIFFFFFNNYQPLRSDVKKMAVVWVVPSKHGEEGRGGGVPNRVFAVTVKFRQSEN